MASSCVPPKNCVVHDPDPSGHDDQSDTSSECGSLCTCTSGSMASIATIGNNSRVPDRSGQDAESTALVPPPTDTQGVPREEEVEQGSHGYHAVRVPQPQRVMCCSKLKVPGFASSLRSFLMTSSEFIPWVTALIVIYYSYCWWGMASGFSAALFMIGAYAVLRLVRTQGVLSCIPQSSRTRVRRVSSNVEDEEETELQTVSQEAAIDHSSEKPPSYDVAVVKPPPYDLQLHLTPEKPPSKAAGHPGPVTVSVERWMPPNNNETETNTLPSYQDAVKLCQHATAGTESRDSQHT